MKDVLQEMVARLQAVPWIRVDVFIDSVMAHEIIIGKERKWINKLIPSFFSHNLENSRSINEIEQKVDEIHNQNAQERLETLLEESQTLRESETAKPEKERDFSLGVSTQLNVSKPSKSSDTQLESLQESSTKHPWNDVVQHIVDSFIMLPSVEDLNSHSRL